jgi:hypothetical protein
VDVGAVKSAKQNFFQFSAIKTDASARWTSDNERACLFVVVVAYSRVRTTDFGCI